MSTAKNRGLIIALIISLIMSTGLLLAGCSVPFLDNKDAEETTEQAAVNNGQDAENQSEARTEADNQSQAGTDNIDNSDSAKEDESDETVTQQAEQEPEGPKLTVNLPDTMTTSYDELKVSGTAATDANVYVNGQAVKLKNDGTFSTEVSLTPGDNNVQAVAVDSSGASTTVTKKVIFNAKYPSLQIFAPKQSTTEDVEVSGYTDPGCIVYLDNQKLKADTKGGFSGTVKIKNKGSNTVEATAVNSYGLSTSKNFNVDGVPPKLQAAAPEMTTDDTATVSGVTDAGSSIVILVGSKEVTVDNDNGTFSQQLTLEPGLNDITVMATNIFGTTELPLTILYDDYEY